MIKLLYKLNQRGLSQLSDGSFCTHSLPAGFDNFFDNFNAAYRDLELTYCRNFYTGKLLPKKQINQILATQKIIKIA
ncbi:MAG TPA: hypothetical protein IAD26_08390 [Candidatus Limenecus avicola]|jgi:hypothetical protein|uniref:Uncharacterized protein n=1 Tax=Candidatus Limenecus avicola TaxID=2840847 RepID=A0A9D1N145_9CLOT|nr:hypothetical protein [Candidatus Limenecus avicola]